MGFFILVVALSLSAVAAWYSVAGLMVLFAAAAIPVAIMASTLEVAKLVTASWLYNRWYRIPLALKSYLVFAVLVLMFVTSLGIFGFLSKAHLDQAMPAGDISTKLEIIDTKIQSQHTNIDSAKTVLKQMDDTVNQALGRGSSALPANATAAQQQAATAAAERNTNQAANLRKTQAKERDNQQNIINKAQEAIQKLKEERAPIAGQQRHLEAEVGPIKYVAELIWGEESKNHFDSAVRFLIITLIFVFDPLAVLLVIAANMTFAWDREDKEKSEQEIEPASTLQPIVPTPEQPVVVTPEIKPSVYEIDSQVKIDLANAIAPLVNNVTAVKSAANMDINASTEADAITPAPMVWSGSRIHEINSRLKMKLEESSNVEVDNNIDSSIIEPLTLFPEEEVKEALLKADDDVLEEVYSRIVNETRVSPTVRREGGIVVEEGYDDGLHKHSGHGTPPGSWHPEHKK